MNPVMQPRLQSGSMALLFALVLLVGAGILTISGTRTSVMEQRIASNEYRAEEARQAAQAGLDYALAWLGTHLWRPGESAPSPPDIQAAHGETYQIRLTFSKRTDGVCVRSRADAETATETGASVWGCIDQHGLFDASQATGMPAPLVLAGCMAAPTEPAALILNERTTFAVQTGQDANPSRLPQGSLEVSTWSDGNADHVMAASEEGASGSYRRGHFAGCPGARCAWNSVFAMGLEEAKGLAIKADHSYSGELPCGGSKAPGIYLIATSDLVSGSKMTGSCVGEDGVDAHTIGTPTHPILLIVPSDSGCTPFAADISIYGIVYYESPTACSAQGWGGARIQGAVIWEGDIGTLAADSRIIATDYGVGSALDDAFQVVHGAAVIPGTWRDWD
mgnify:FL=1